MTCQSFNSTCFEKMHTFVNECLTTGSTSPLAEAYQFDLYLREEACVRNKTTIIDDWTNGTEKCLSPYFLKDGNVLRRAVAECKRRHPTSEVKLSHGYSNKILACVKDRINAPSCICHWGTDGCNPTAMLMRNYYVESVVSLLLFVERPQ
ncbi:hypothetical protein Fcan01_04524 [Folsomia candida]|uniref:Uncharacterized protein n=1 Tax=Folsomia candida TaxID=158441 RepID=A0A226EQ77_FOLCA|nr:hypothetical protein Fcan01_04524 [Folsomia candida]